MPVHRRGASSSDSPVVSPADAFALRAEEQELSSRSRVLHDLDPALLRMSPALTVVSVTGSS